MPLCQFNTCTHLLGSSMGDLGSIIILRLVVLECLHGFVSGGGTDHLVGKVRLIFDGRIGIDTEKLVSLRGDGIFVKVRRDLASEVY